MGVGAGLVEVATALLMALGLTGPKKLSCPPPPSHSNLEEGLLIARWRAANEPAEDLEDSCDGIKGFPEFP